METSFVAVSLCILTIFAIGFVFGIVCTLFIGGYSRPAQQQETKQVPRHSARKVEE